MKARMQHAGVENRRGASSLLTISEVNTIVRRLGYVLVRVHQVLVENALAHDEVELAERLGDQLKPLADLLAHFTLEDDSSGS